MRVFVAKDIVFLSLYSVLPTTNMVQFMSEQRELSGSLTIRNTIVLLCAPE